MHKVHVQVEKPYDVLIGSGILKDAGALIAGVISPCRAAIISDDTVDALYGDKLQLSLQNAGFSTCRTHFAHGEEHKNLQTYAKLMDFLCENQITRADIIVALGGGVVGDTAGFAAATYLRGVRFVQVPTTLLAMVDSSVGGKTAVDLPHGKNLCGAFWQPSLVVCDTDTLGTLPDIVYTDGLAECLKHGVLKDEGLFHLLAKEDARKNINKIVARNVAIKAEYVAQDERDTGLRQQLNLGHTLGHAVEKLSRFTITHGQAVAIGMVYAAKIACKMQLCDASVPADIEATVRSVGLPTQAEFSAQEIARVALGDKKRMGDTLRMVLPLAIGRCTLQNVPVDALQEVISLGVNA